MASDHSGRSDADADTGAGERDEVDDERYRNGGEQLGQQGIQYKHHVTFLSTLFSFLTFVRTISFTECFALNS